MAGTIQTLAKTNIFGEGAEVCWVPPDALPVLQDTGLILSGGHMDHHAFGTVGTLYPQLLSPLTGSFEVFLAAEERWARLSPGMNMVCPTGVPNAHRGLGTRMTFFGIQWKNPRSFAAFNKRFSKTTIVPFDAAPLANAFEAMYQEYHTRRDTPLLLNWAMLIDRMAKLLVLEDAIHRRTDSLRSRIAGDLQRPWEVDDFARELSVSRNQARRICLAELGMTPMALVCQTRMQIAAALLTQGDMAIKTIAEHVGYSSQFTFTRVFTRFHGIAPGAYRRSKRS